VGVVEVGLLEVVGLEVVVAVVTIGEIFLVVEVKVGAVVLMDHGKVLSLIFRK
jgi:hypothetical protein